jgi:hypothetical protein
MESNYIYVDESVHMKNESHYDTNSSLLIIVCLFQTSSHSSFVEDATICFKEKVSESSMLVSVIFHLSFTDSSFKNA